MADTPRSALPVISEGLIIRAKLGTLGVIAGALMTGLVGGTLFFAKLTDFMTAIDQRMKRVEGALGIDVWTYAPPPTPKHSNP